MSSNRVPGATTSDFNKTIPVACDKGEARCKVSGESEATAKWLKETETTPFPATRERGGSTEYEETDGGGASPLVYASSTDPTVELLYKSCSESETKSTLNKRIVRLPAATKTNVKNEDRHLSIVLPPPKSGTGEAKETGEVADLWHAEFEPLPPEKPTKIRYCTAGIANMSGSLIAGKNKEDGQLEDTDGAGFQLQAGYIRGPELKAGAVNHAVVAYVNECKAERVGSGYKGLFVEPAVHSDCGEVCAKPAERCLKKEAPAEGARLFLEYTASQIDDKTETPVTSETEEESFKEGHPHKWKPWKAAVIKAIARYGVYIRDQGNSSFSIQFEGGLNYVPFGAPEPFSQIAQEQHLEKAGEHYLFNLERGVEWEKRLKTCEKWNCE
jgi:hypothetical protein